MTRPRLLDLGCGAGGASEGYHRAGFDVTGVDIADQPHYPYDFLQADMLEVLAIITSGNFGARIDVIHASPPCQHHANVTNWRGSQASHPDLLTPTLEILGELTIPWVVENVPEALPSWDYLLCGTNFGLPVKRHRGFRRGNWAGYSLLPPCQCRRNPKVLPFMHKGERAYTDAMGCGWMTRDEGRQAIPPAYTEHIGAQLMTHLREVAA